MKVSKPAFLFLIAATIGMGCSQKIPSTLQIRWSESPIPPAVDYTKESNWAALPNRKDAADFVPVKSSLKDEQSTAKADVFFIHPTILTYTPTNEFQWNASVEDTYLNQLVDSSTILNQATIFNAVGRIFAPRYRQAHYHAFVTKFKEDKAASLDLAYTDVKNAFNYYMANHNHGRPIIIASHSQGTVHAARLLQEFFDGKALQKQLVAAYIVGIVTPKNIFNTIPVCENATQTGCFVGWTTFLNGYLPDWHDGKAQNVVSVNPLSWSTDEKFVSNIQNKGGVSYGFKWAPNFADAQNHLGVLWTHTPFVFGRKFVHINNWHKADMNLYYMSIRENAQNRLNAYLKTNN